MGPLVDAAVRDGDPSSVRNLDLHGGSRDQVRSTVELAAYADVVEALMDPGGIFACPMHSEPLVRPLPYGPRTRRVLARSIREGLVVPASFAVARPEQLAAFRELMGRRLRGGSLRRLRAIIRARATRLVAEADWPLDVGLGVVEPAVLATIGDLIGLPGDLAARQRWLRSLAMLLGQLYSDVMLDDETAADHMAARMEFFSEVSAALDVRSTNPTDDVLGDLAAEPGLSRGEALGMVEILYLGGYGSPVGLSVAAIRRCNESAELRAMLFSRRAYRLVDELARVEPMGTVAFRYAQRTSPLGTSRVDAGDFVRLQLAAADRDPAVFARPEQFDPNRHDLNRSLGFGLGSRYCLGAALGRLFVIEIARAVLGGPSPSRSPLDVLSSRLPTAFPDFGHLMVALSGPGSV